MSIQFYYWNYQCPVSLDCIKLLKTYESQIDISYIDVSRQPQLAKKMQMFFPFLTVFGNQLRVYGPIKEKMMEAYLKGEAYLEKPYVIEHGKAIFRGELVKLTEANIGRIKEGCSLSGCQVACEKKSDFLKSLGCETYGFLNLEGGKVVGGVECVPSNVVPYDIPKGDNIAFLTCLYHSSTDMDYKTHPYEALEAELKEAYDFIVAVTDEVGTFPNGPLAWFESQAFVDLGVVYEAPHYARLHLVMKNIQDKFERNEE